jgi:hypothetical protein
MTVAYLEHLLDDKKRRLATLHKKRDRLERRLNAVVIQIDRIGGTRRQANAHRPRTIARAKNDRTLKEVVTELLRQSKKGLGLDELSKRVLATGYQTTSTNFKNTLYQTLYHHDGIRLDKENGLYRLV